MPQVLHYTCYKLFVILIWKYCLINKIPFAPLLGNMLYVNTPLEFIFQEQSYSSLHSGQSLAWDNICGHIDDPCGVIADFWEVIADPCSLVAIPEAIGGRAVADAAPPIVGRHAKHHKILLNIVKHHETHVKHCDTSWSTSKTSWNTLKTMWNIMKHLNTRYSMRRYRRSMRRRRRSMRNFWRLRCWCNFADV